MLTPRPRAGLTLVEILLAGFIMAVVMVPIIQLISSGNTRTRVGRDRATAATLAANIMGSLLEKVPFSQITPDAGPTPLGPDAGILVQGIESPSPIAGSRKQARLGPDNQNEYERMLDETPGDDSRLITREGTKFEVILFAGLYKDVASPPVDGFNEPDIKRELTFSYFRNPYLNLTPDDRASIRRRVRLDGSIDKAFPYNSDGTTDGPDSVTRVADPRFKAGWPQPTGGTPDPITNRLSVNETNFSQTRGKRWAVHTLDQADFREDGGAFMKLVLGLRWKSMGAAAAGQGNSRTSKEYWLVSFKAKLEEE